MGYRIGCRRKNEIGRIEPGDTMAKAGDGAGQGAMVGGRKRRTVETKTVGEENGGREGMGKDGQAM